MALLSHAVGRTERLSAWNEVFALVLLFAGTLLFFALISYTPKDIPSWFWFSHVSPANHPAQNFIGPLGAIVAGICYQLIGVFASLLLAAVLLGFGAAKLFYPRLRVAIRIPWIILFLISGACLDQAWGISHFLGRKVPVDIQGPGGLIGYRLSDEHRGLLPAALGPVGSVLLVVGVYLTTLILVTGLRPIHLVREMVNLSRRSVAKLYEWRVRRTIRKSDLKEQLKTQKGRRALEALQKQLKKKGVPVPEPVATMISPDELANRPAPKVVDTTVPSTEPVASRRRPSLAELRASEEKSKAAPSPSSATSSWEDYVLPGLDLLEEHSLEARTATDPSELQEVQQILIETLAQFGIAVGPGDITKGPTITRYEVYPAKGVRVDKIVSLERDLARATSAERINILAPIPGKDTVGIELANTRKVTVKLRELFQSSDWDSAKEHAKIPLALGKDVYGKTIIADLAQMPHLLVAGTTGSGKSVCINALIASMLFRFTPEEMRLVIIDPKMVEMQAYQSLPHLSFPIVTDPKKVLLALRWLIDEMERRYRMFARVGVRNIVGFNARPKKKTQMELDAEAVESGVSPDRARRSAETADATPIKVPREDEEVVPDRIPYVVVIVDELADLMQTAPADVETAIARITQMARAAGMHVIVATQTPRADVITGVIKANIPSRIAFQVASKIDSRVILDENGADRLLGQGDMLYLPPSASRLIRAQGVLVTDNEIHALVEFISKQSPPAFDTAMHEKLQSSSAPEEEVTAEDEELVEKCIEIIRQEKRASTSLLQRRLRLGYTRAARIVDILEQRGILGPGEGAKPREILVDLDAAV
ncbi:MAG: DNA translocase SpoIIIE [Candidatus Udaeobacter sp.]|jgi:DNA segregation ATPase FtsK/SpoIIIE, S-DNA-T family|nr:MAG: DNA translocase SpoIIIE [Candidatus Udaeobacter sp.]